MIAFDKSGTLFGYAGLDNFIQIWDVDSGFLRCRLGDMADKGESINAICWGEQPKGRKGKHMLPLLAAGGKMGKVVVWNADKSQVLMILKGDSEVRDMAFDARGHFLITVTSDKNIYVWSLVSKSIVNKFSAGRGTPWRLIAFARDSGVQALCASSKYLRLFDVSSGTRISRTTAGHVSPVTALAGWQHGDSGHSWAVHGSDSFLHAVELSSAGSKSAEERREVLKVGAKVVRCHAGVGAGGLAMVAAVAENGTARVWKGVGGEAAGAPRDADVRVTVAAGSGHGGVLCASVVGGDEGAKVVVAFGTPARVRFDRIDLATSGADVVLGAPVSPAQDGEAARETSRAVVGSGFVASDAATELVMDRSSLLALAARVEALKGQGESKPAGEGAPKAESLETVAVQALSSEDRHLLEFVLQHSDRKLIRKTVSNLPVAFVVPFLKQVVSRLASKPGRVHALSLWVSELITVWSAYLISLPGVERLLAPLQGTISQRVSQYRKLLRLRSRLDLVLGQIKAGEVAEAREARDMAQVVEIDDVVEASGGEQDDGDELSSVYSSDEEGSLT